MTDIAEYSLLNTQPKTLILLLSGRRTKLPQNMPTTSGKQTQPMHPSSFPP